MTDYEALIAEARAAAVDSGLPDPIAQAAFVEILRHKLWGTAPSGGAADTSGGRNQVQTTEGLVNRIAVELGVDATVLDDVYEERDGVVDVRVPASRLPHSKAAAAREIAQLVGAVALATGDGWTTFDDVRDVCTSYARYDGPNFASAIRALGDIATVRNRAGKYELRLTRPGREATAELVTRLGGGAKP
jgi:hypothetical protein